MRTFVKTTRIRRSAADVFAWHERPGALQRLSPPWAKIAVESAEGGIKDGAEVRLRQKIGPFTGRWHIRHEGYLKGRAFSDRQVSGPFKEWVHHHEFKAVDAVSCDLVDRIVYELPMESLSGKPAGQYVDRELDRAFHYRHNVTRMDLETHPLPKAKRSLVIALTGATGLIGSSLTAMLQAGGHQVRGISRGSAAEIQWNPDGGRLDPDFLEGVDAVIHLAGEPIAQRWTSDARRRILDSRRKGTRLLADTVAGLKKPPSVFISISGVNAYGAEQAEPVTEMSPFGEGFLAEVCREWEGAAEAVDAAGIRKVIIRSSIVLSPAGGALAKLLPVFRSGLGGPIGKGQRWMSWIAIDDLAALFAHAVLNEEYRGVINAVAPNPVRNDEFTETLAHCLHRPAVTPVPPAVLRLALGQMASETVLGDLRVRSERLGELDYRFRFPHLREALGHLLGKLE